MGLRKVTRGAGKVGLALEALGYVLTTAKALGRAIKRSTSEDSDDENGTAQNGDAPEKPFERS